MIWKGKEESVTIKIYFVIMFLLKFPVFLFYTHTHTHTHTHIYIYIYTYIYIYIYIYIYKKTLDIILILQPRFFLYLEKSKSSYRLKFDLVWFGLVLWYITHCWLFNAKSCFYIYTKYMIRKPILYIHTLKKSNSSISNNWV